MVTSPEKGACKNVTVHCGRDEVDYLLLGVTFESEAPPVHLVVSAFMVLLEYIGCANVAKYSAVKKYLLSS